VDEKKLALFLFFNIPITLPKIPFFLSLEREFRVPTFGYFCFFYFSQHLASKSIRKFSLYKSLLNYCPPVLFCFKEQSSAAHSSNDFKTVKQKTQEKNSKTKGSIN
jgi:hypothetical protein